MPWKLNPRNHVVYPRNPLVTVIVDLRFHPILKVADRKADYQDLVREDYPQYQESRQQLVNLHPLGAVNVSEDRVFTFRTADGSSTLTLTTGALSLDARAHQDRAQLLRLVHVATEALTSTYGQVSPVRFGLRYVNDIDREQVADDLGRSVEWGELVTSRFLSVPGGLADEADAHFLTEVTAPVDPGAMTLRFGRIQDLRRKRELFRFDVDRFLEGGFAVQDVGGLLDQFADHIYSLFIESRAPALEEWMSQEEKPQ